MHNIKVLVMADNIVSETYRCSCCRKLYKIDMPADKPIKDVIIRDLECCPSGKILGLLIRITHPPKCHKCGTLITDQDEEDIRDGLSYGRKCSLCGQSLFEIRFPKQI